MASSAAHGLAIAALAAASLAVPAWGALPDALTGTTWTEGRVGGFVIVTDMGPGVVITAGRSLGDMSEALHRTSQSIALVSPLPTYVFIFGEHELFEYYLDAPDANAAAVFMRGWDRNLILVDGSNPDKWRALHHEYMHCHLRANFPGIPVWLDEGLAEYYSTFKAKDMTVEAGGDLHWYSYWLNHAPSQSLETLFAFHPGAAVYRRVGIMQESLYAQGWALVQYLESQPDNANRFDQFLTRHRSGVPARRAFAEQFPSETWPALMDQMRAYIQAGFIMPRSWKLSQPLADHTPATSDMSTPEAEVALGLLGFFTGEFGMADEHLQAARAVGYSDVAALAALGAIADHRHQPAAAESLYAKVEAIPKRAPIADLLIAEGTYVRAVALADSDTVAAHAAFELARGRFQRCVAADPGNLIAAAGWARTFQFQHPPPAEAIQALKKASDALPARADLAISLFLLELSAGKFDAAAQLIDSRLAATLTPPDLVQARGMLEAAKH